MDELKKYLQNNLELLEDDLPSSMAWGNVKHRVNFIEKKSNKLYSISKYFVAACIFLLAGISVMHLIQNTNQTTNNNAVQAHDTSKKTADTQFAVEQFADTPISIVQKTATSIASAIFADTQVITNIVSNIVKPNISNNCGQIKNIDSQFSYVINLQKKVVNTTPIYTESPSFFNDFILSFKQMENDELVVKKDIEKVGITSDLLEQLINVNQQKLNLLKLLQTEINKTNFRYKQNRNLIDTTKIFYIEI
ncbi:MAG: hypothetical protein ACOVO1_02015 [Chitinophagaceae bacterium]